MEQGFAKEVCSTRTLVEGLNCKSYVSHQTEDKEPGSHMWRCAQVPSRVYDMIRRHSFYIYSVFTYCIAFYLG